MASTAPSDGTIAATFTARDVEPAGHLAERRQHAGPPRLVGVVLEAGPGAGIPTVVGHPRPGQHGPSPSTATALTDVVPMSIPTVTFASPTSPSVAHGPIYAPRRSATGG